MTRRPWAVPGVVKPEHSFFSVGFSGSQNSDNRSIFLCRVPGFSGQRYALHLSLSGSRPPGSAIQIPTKIPTTKSQPHIHTQTRQHPYNKTTTTTPTQRQLTSPKTCSKPSSGGRGPPTRGKRTKFAKTEEAQKSEIDNQPTGNDTNATPVKKSENLL